MSKAGKEGEVGSQHPSPERIPHSVPAHLKKNNLANSPAKESTLTHETKE